MYRLEYKIGLVNAVVKNHDPKVLREVIKRLKKEDTWKLFNCGGICLDSSDELNSSEEHTKEKGG